MTNDHVINVITLIHPVDDERQIQGADTALAERLNEGYQIIGFDIVPYYRTVRRIQSKMQPDMKAAAGSQRQVTLRR